MSYYRGPERRQSSTMERVAWLRVYAVRTRGWYALKRRVSTAVVTMTGWTIGALACIAASGAYTPWLAAEAPISVSQEGIAYILWTVIGCLTAGLVYFMKAWKEKKDQDDAALRQAFQDLRIELERLKGKRQCQRHDEEDE